MYIRAVWRGNKQPSPLKDLRILLAPPIHPPRFLDLCSVYFYCPFGLFDVSDLYLLEGPLFNEIQNIFQQSLLSLFSLIWDESSPSVVQVNP